MFFCFLFSLIRALRAYLETFHLHAYGCFAMFVVVAVVGADAVCVDSFSCFLISILIVFCCHSSVVCWAVVLCACNPFARALTPNSVCYVCERKCGHTVVGRH